MADPLPQLYFRVRENGAVVFRLDTENRNRALDLQQIAVVNTNRGDYKPHGDQVLSAEEDAAIKDWLVTRQAALAARDLDDVRRSVDQINLTAQWAQSKATDAQLAEVTEDLLLAMHDLRNVLLRKKSDRLDRSD
ncbi:MAG: hypothetical protein AAFU41_13450 [Pseudomonadota bacterium]